MSLFSSDWLFAHFCLLSLLQGFEARHSPTERDLVNSEFVSVTASDEYSLFYGIALKHRSECSTVFHEYLILQTLKITDN